MIEPQAQVVFHPKKADQDAEAVFAEILAADLAVATPQVHLASGADNIPEYQRLDVSPELSRYFTGIVRERLDELRKKPVEIRRYDASAHLAGFQVEYFDLELEDHRYVAEQLGPLFEEGLKDPFDGDDQFVSDLRFYCISQHGATDEPIYFYRSYTKKLELSRSSFFAAVFSAGRFDRPNEKTFLFDRQIDCISSGRYLFILAKERFHQNFRFFDYLKKEAKRTLNRVKAMVPIANFTNFQKDTQTSVTKLAKVLSISKRPYLARREVTIDDMRRVIEEFDLDIDIVVQRGTEKLLYDPQRPWELLRLLDDDYLVSDMTGRGYEVTGKRLHEIRRPPRGGARVGRDNESSGSRPRAVA